MAPIFVKVLGIALNTISLCSHRTLRNRYGYWFGASRREEAQRKTHSEKVEGAYMPLMRRPLIEKVPDTTLKRGYNILQTSPTVKISVFEHGDHEQFSNRL